MKTSEIKKILTFNKNAPTTDGVLWVPTNDCHRWKGLKKRSATSQLPGARTRTAATREKNRTVLALETRIARPPRARDPLPGGRRFERVGGAGPPRGHPIL
jgi:hypothetical protein